MLGGDLRPQRLLLPVHRQDLLLQSFDSLLGLGQCPDALLHFRASRLPLVFQGADLGFQVPHAALLSFKPFLFPSFVICQFFCQVGRFLLQSLGARGELADSSLQLGVELAAVGQVRLHPQQVRFQTLPLLQQLGHPGFLLLRVPAAGVQLRFHLGHPGLQPELPLQQGVGLGGALRLLTLQRV